MCIRDSSLSLSLLCTSRPNHVLCRTDDNDLVLLVLLDLSAVFDAIDHGTVLTRLYDEVGISSTAHQWFCSFLANRTRHVTVNKSFSEDRPLTCRVPRGPVLAPILFSLYTTQMAESQRSMMLGGSLLLTVLNCIALSIQTLHKPLPLFTLLMSVVEM